MTDLTPNIPEVVAEVSAMFERYEQALIDKNVEALDATFWNSPHTIRLANAEHGYGYDRIHAFRVARPPGPGTKEKRIRLEILTLGRDLWIEAEPTFQLPPRQIARSPRIGISTAQQQLLRFYVRDNPFVSGRKG